MAFMDIQSDKTQLEARFREQSFNGSITKRPYVFFNFEVLNTELKYQACGTNYG